MISHFSGCPGSGKSLRMASMIRERLLLKKETLANFDINPDAFKPSQFEHFHYVPNEVLTPKFLADFSEQYFSTHPFKEGKLVIFIDEAQVIFDTRRWSDDGRGNSAGVPRSDWVKFFTLHRKLGYDIYLISQMAGAGMLDKQIRSLIEYEWHHRKVNNFGVLGFFVSILLLGHPLVVSVCTWFTAKQRITSKWIIGRKSLYKIYDTRAVFN